MGMGKDAQKPYLNRAIYIICIYMVINFVTFFSQNKLEHTYESLLNINGK